MATGRCNCGAVRFEVDANLTDVYVCHCSICRRFTGSNGIAVVIVPNAHLRFVAGQECISTWQKPDADWQSWFCRVCGSPVPGANAADTVFIPAGTLAAGDERLRVVHHVWVGSKAIWDVIGDAGQQHLEGLSVREQ